ELTDNSVYTSAERVEAAVNGVYDAAQSGFYAGNIIRGYPFGSANIQQGDMRGEDMGLTVSFYSLTYESIFNNASPNNDFMFQTLYALINKANLTIDGVNIAASKGIISSTLAPVYIGEMRFLRAMAHHELMINFARPYRDGNGTQLGIIYRDFAVNGAIAAAAAAALKRTTIADNYTKLLADLDFAEANLPATNAAGPAPFNAAANKTYRATKAAAIALKMRARLHMGDWANVLIEGNKLIPATPSLSSYPGFTSLIGGWKLENAPNTPFTTAGWQGNETVFSIRNATTDQNGPNGALAQMAGNPAIGGRGVIRVSPILFNLPAFRCDDLRRNLMSIAGSGALAYYVTSKYTDAVGQSDPAPQIRWAEVLLTMAEAEARLNGISTKALQLLNDVRNRALPGGPGNFTTPPVNSYTTGSFGNSTAFIRAILDERRIEFAGEGKRWGDIHRNGTDANFNTGGIPAKMAIGGANPCCPAVVFALYSCGIGNTLLVPSVPSYPYSDFRFIWPIPLSETQVNQNYEQNPGYPR
nr:RagB/SusD family nutrient uptake outer membrane protein [Ferruginibacter sp.]